MTGDAPGGTSPPRPAAQSLRIDVLSLDLYGLPADGIEV